MFGLVWFYVEHYFSKMKFAFGSLTSDLNYVTSGLRLLHQHWLRLRRRWGQCWSSSGRMYSERLFTISAGFVLAIWHASRTCLSIGFGPVLITEKVLAVGPPRYWGYPPCADWPVCECWTQFHINTYCHIIGKSRCNLHPSRITSSVNQNEVSWIEAAS